MSLHSSSPSWLAGVLAAGLSLAAIAEPQTLTTPRGATISILADLPEGEGPFPALVLAPGQGYHMQMPLLAKLSTALRGRGVAVLRFDWAFYTQQPQRGEVSADLVPELEDMATVLAHARQHARIDPKRIMAGGKSLGSLVGWRLLQQEGGLKAGLLLTPVCSRQEPGGVVVGELARNYPGLEQEDRPLAWIAGERDPYCDAPLLYQFAGSAGRSVRVSLIGGDHSFKAGPPGEPEVDAQSARNIDLAVQLATDFVVTALKP
ncbi:alpha/beta family hydrolase [Chitinimonas sp.]|uniref:alpha/beta family hydrolase n=1 Tax=Chitinimonas sp. TaxID=1934313 RepID=UPI002F938FA0